MADDEILEAVAEKVEPSRRKFVLGLLAAGITAPSVASFVMGKTGGSSRVATPVRPASIIDGSGNFYTDPSANSMYETYMSGNFLRDSSGNFMLDSSGNLLCGTSGNILLDGSGNALYNYSANQPYVLHPSGNWSYDPSSNAIGLPLRDASGNAYYQFVELDASGNAFYDQWFNYDSNGVINWNSSPQIPGLACVVSANHIQVAQAPNTTTVAPAPTTTTTTPVTPVTVSGTIPNVK
jgi:hypothetical protein